VKPTVINILGKSYKISYLELEEDDGLCKNKESEIDIDKNLEGIELVHTLLHEYFHGVLFRTGVTQVLSDDIEEVICDSFATFLVDNGLVKQNTE